jgi:hypothetical protein
VASTTPSVQPGDRVTAVVNRLGTPQEEVILGKTNLRRLRFPRHVIEVIATDVVLAVCLTQSTSPALSVGDREERLRVGMTKAEVQRLASRPSPDWPVATMSSSQFFFPEQGLAVRLADGKVAELVLVEIARPGERER